MSLESLWRFTVVNGILHKKIAGLLVETEKLSGSLDKGKEKRDNNSVRLETSDTKEF